MADEQILVAGTAAVPVSYTVPNAIEAALLCVNATIDGSAAPSNFLATVEIVSDGGVVVARCPCFTTIPAGGSAEISWFRLRDSDITSTPTTTAYEQLILATGGLVLYWKLDDDPGSTTTADKLGVNNGTVYDAVTFNEPALADGTSALYGAGMSGFKSGLNLDGTSQVMTCLCWIKTTAAAMFNFIAWADTNAAGGRWFQFLTAAAGTVFVEIFDNGSIAHGFGGSVVVNDGLKHCVAFVYDATNPVTGAGAVGSVYVDGVLDAATPIAMGGVGLSKDRQSLVLGAEWRNAFDNPSGISKYAGIIDEFAIFNTALTAAQIAAINTAGRVV